MNTNFLTHLNKIKYVFIAAWILWALYSYLILDIHFLRAIGHGLFYALILNLITYLTGTDLPDIFAKPEHEENIRQRISELGYTLSKTKENTNFFYKKGFLNTNKIRFTSTSYILKIGIPLALIDSFKEFSSSEIK